MPVGSAAFDKVMQQSVVPRCRLVKASGKRYEPCLYAECSDEKFPLRRGLGEHYTHHCYGKRAPRALYEPFYRTCSY